MAGYDALSDFVNQEADYNFASGLEMLKRGGGWLMDATSPFSQAVSEPLNQDIKRFADYVNESSVGKVVAQGAQAVQDSGADYGVPVVGAMWGPTRKLLKTLSPEHFQSLSAKDLQVLERATEAYPSVKNAGLQNFIEDAFHGPLSNPELKTYLEGKAPGMIYLTEPQNYINHPMEKKLSSPAMSLLHEGGAGHAVTGSSAELTSWGKFKEPNFTMYDNPTRMAAEGFAEGGSHTAMNKYNKDVFAPYWQDYKEYPSDLRDIYIKSGYLGADFGSDLRKGLVPDQSEAIYQLLNILKGVY